MVSDIKALENPKANLQAWPIPFSNKLNIGFKLEQAGFVQLVIQDIYGSPVAQPITGTYPAGEHLLEWGPSGLAPGVYFCQLKTRQGQQIVKTVFTR